MGRGYHVFAVNLAKKFKEIKEGKEVILEVQSLDDGVTHTVRAIIDSPDKLPDGEHLGVLSDDGRLKDEKWAIKILEELDPEDVDLEEPIPPGTPVSGLMT